MWIYPPIKGSVVIRNPEHSSYAALSEKKRGMGGVVVCSSTRPHHEYSPHMKVTVEWEEGTTERISCDMLLPLHNVHEDVYSYVLSNHDVYRGTKERIKVILDEMVIRRGWTIITESKYDKRERDGFLRDYFKALENRKNTGGVELVEAEQLAYAELIIDGCDKSPSTEDSEN